MRRLFGIATVVIVAATLSGCAPQSGGSSASAADGGWAVENRERMASAEGLKSTRARDCVQTFEDYFYEARDAAQAVGMSDDEGFHAAIGRWAKGRNIVEHEPGKIQGYMKRVRAGRVSNDVWVPPSVQVTTICSEAKAATLDMWAVAGVDDAQPPEYPDWYGELGPESERGSDQHTSAEPSETVEIP